VVFQLKLIQKPPAGLVIADREPRKWVDENSRRLVNELVQKMHMLKTEWHSMIT
jgi:hypothetical protein